ncbi:hypothetical protein GCM10010218_42040 [Streptomyces mashuensis]|uniref:Uncharacterized protein n=1 Tax=Streptomyces mashuensis TaxID=33904 RepID=A0A919EDH0_9ACTN|nr:hypothetical protein GCM10010218_42040 [Streptomyces mashuensis]
MFLAVLLAPVPPPVAAPGSLGPQVIGALAQSATAMHISTRPLFYAAQPPPRNQIIVSETSPVRGVRNARPRGTGTL